MPRGAIPVSRVQDNEPTGQRKGSSWLEHVSDMLAQKQQSAVDQARARASMINQVNNILSNPPRYATVDDAVQDMRERTGLNDYLRNIKAEEQNVNVKTASAPNRDEDGLLKRSVAKNMVSFINSKKKILRTAEYDIPESLKKYDHEAVEDIIAFVQNNIENSHGLAASIPQLQHDIVHILGRKYGIGAEDIMNSEVAKFLNQFIIDSQSKLGPTETSPRLGEGVGQDLSDDENEDYWAGMMPNTK